MLQPSDRKYDRHQAPDLPGKNQPIGASTLKRIVDMVLDLVREGRGIEVRRVGQHVYIHNKIVPKASIISARGNTNWYEAPTKGELENDDVPRQSFGLVVGEGADNGMFCIRNPDNDGWDAINFLE